MFHGSSETVDWLLSPIGFIAEWLAWPLQQVALHF